MQRELTTGTRRFSALPFLLGLLFFAASLTPSLVPRPWFVGGALGGLLTAVGYLIGQSILTLWRAMELPVLRGPAARSAHLIVAIPVVGVWIYALSRAADWQDTIRAHVGMAPAEGFHTPGLLGVAAAVFVVCFLIGWGVQMLYDLIRHRLYRHMPVRTANVLGLLLAGLLLFVGTRDGLLRRALDMLDQSYEAAQELFALAPPPPADPQMPGGPGSLVDWGAMGQRGRDFLTSGPDAAAISAFTGRPAKRPVRVYVGRAEADTPEARAAVALAELQRLGGFDRKVLIVASPTGTGWLDPAGHDTVEIMHDGDVATVTVQYSYLQSPLALVFETRSGLDQASATMRAVYDYWRTLPPDHRPALYLHGISLGAWSSMYSFDIFQIINDPVQGAFWIGPPFPSEHWRRAVNSRNPGSRYVAPVVGDGSLVRFMTQFEGMDRAAAPWGRMRIGYLQYASDAIVFYEPSSVWRAPEWLREPPAPDVSPEMRFVPVVTQFQLALDMMLALATPAGYGHNYAARDYVDGWVSVTAPEGWTAEDSARLKDLCASVPGQGCVVH